MSTEIETIAKIAALFPRSHDQVNGLQEADAEVITVNGSLIALNVDEFSDGEDFFSDSDPEVLGWNIACGVLSDILAVGAIPRFVAQSCVVTPVFDGPFGEAFFRGVSSAVSAAGAFLAGGDTSTGPAWRYTGVAIGDFGGMNRVDGHFFQASAEAVKPPRPGPAILRTGILPGDRLYLTGTAGSGNLMALAKIASRSADSAVPSFCPRFPIRFKASRAASQHARACIDTSDGFARSLEILDMVNDTGFVAAPGLIPLFPGCAEAIAAAGLPKVMALLGSAGEYELLIVVPPEREKAFLEALEGEPIALAGMAVDSPGIWFADSAISDSVEFMSIWADGLMPDGFPESPRAGKARATRLSLPLPDPRSPAGIECYLRDLGGLAMKLR